MLAVSQPSDAELYQYAIDLEVERILQRAAQDVSNPLLELIRARAEGREFHFRGD